ncbi:MFS transporter [Micromonospora sp. NPDC049114]|uniref:MFS transporter n=1 Tax=unclassified Micromonospora TaxID=2617518 RepID=UPI0033EF2A81
MIMNLLDATVVNIAAQAIRADLGGSHASVQWIAAACTLALAGGLLTGGRLGDIFGRKVLLLVGAAGFVAASLACAAAWSPDTLIAARTVQGLFAALMIPQAFGLVRTSSRPRRSGRRVRHVGPRDRPVGPGASIVAGLLINADLFALGWRLVFLINAPIGAFTGYRRRHVKQPWRR